MTFRGWLGVKHQVSINPSVCLMPVCLSVCLSVCMSVCVSIVSDSSETIEVITKLGMATASDMGMHHVSIILTLTFIQGHTNLNHENNNLIFFRNDSSNAHHVCCGDSPTKGLSDHRQSDDLALHSRSQLRLKRDHVLSCSIITISRTVFESWYSNLAWR